MEISVVKIVILKPHETFADRTKDMISASEMLKTFCRWQERLKTGSEFDVALLLTREDICRNQGGSGRQENCDTLGLAELGTMCGRSSCAIVQDNGLSAAFTIAHELGHVLNMPHDDDQKCAHISKFNDSKWHVMSRMLDHNTNPWEWSNCSRHYITQFLE